MIDTPMTVTIIATQLDRMSQHYSFPIRSIFLNEIARRSTRHRASCVRLARFEAACTPARRSRGNIGKRIRSRQDSRERRTCGFIAERRGGAHACRHLFWLVTGAVERGRRGTSRRPNRSVELTRGKNTHHRR